MRSSSRSSSTACIAAASEVAAAAAASSGSNGSPATAAPSSRRRPPSDSSASSSLSAAATGGTSRPVTEISGAEAVPPALGRPGELLEVEGVATALLVEDGCAGGVDPLAEELLSLIRRQSAELEPGQHRRTTRPLEGGRKTLRSLEGRSALP